MTISEQIVIEAEIQLVGLSTTAREVKTAAKAMAKNIAGITKDINTKEFEKLGKAAHKARKNIDKAFKKTKVANNFVTQMVKDIKASFTNMVKSVGVGFQALGNKFKAGWDSLSKMGSSGSRKMANGIKLGMKSIAAGFVGIAMLAGPVVIAFAAIGAAGAAAAAAIRPFIKTAALFEKYTAVLTVLEGSSTKAKESMAWITEFAKETPNSLAETTAAFVKMRSYGLDPISGSLKVWSDTAAAMGKPVIQAVEMIADAMQGENERLKEFGVRAAKSGDKIKYAWTDANGKAKEIIIKNNSEIIASTLEAIMNSKYAGAGEALANTWDGIWNNIGGRWEEFKAKVMDQGLFTYFKALSKALGEWFSDSLDEAEKSAGSWTSAIISGIEKTIIGFGYLGQAIDGIKLVIKLITIAFLVAFKGWSKLLDIFIWAWDNGWALINNTFKSIIDTIGEAWYTFMNFMKSTWDSWMSTIAEGANFLLEKANIDFRFEVDNSSLDTYKSSMDEIAVSTLKASDATKSFDKSIEKAKLEAGDLVNDLVYQQSIKNAEKLVETIRKINAEMSDTAAIDERARKEREQAQKELDAIRNKYGLDSMGESKAKKASTAAAKKEAAALAKQIKQIEEIAEAWKKAKRYKEETYGIEESSTDAAVLINKTISNMKSTNLSKTTNNMKIDAGIMRQIQADFEGSAQSLILLKKIISDIYAAFEGGGRTVIFENLRVNLDSLKGDIVSTKEFLEDLNKMGESGVLASNPGSLIGVSYDKGIYHMQIKDATKAQKQNIALKKRYAGINLKIDDKLYKMTLKNAKKHNLSMAEAYQKSLVERRELIKKETNATVAGVDDAFTSLGDLDILGVFQSIGDSIQATLRESFDIKTPLSFFESIAKGFKAVSAEMDAIIASSVWGMIVTIGMKALGELLKGNTISDAEFKAAEGDEFFNNMVIDSLALLNELTRAGLVDTGEMKQSLDLLARESDKASSVIGDTLSGRDYVANNRDGFFSDTTRELLSQGVKIAPASVMDLKNGILEGFNYTKEKVTKETWFTGDEKIQTHKDGDLDSKFVAAYTEALVHGIVAIDKAAESLGMSKIEIDNFTAAWEAASHELNFEGLDANERTELIMAAMGSDMDSYTQTLTPLIGFIEDFKLAGESAGETLIRLSVDLEVVTVAFQDLGIVIGTAAEGGLEMAESITRAYGSAQEFQKFWKWFTENFFTEAEQAEMNKARLEASFAGMGMELPQTKAAFKAMMLQKYDELKVINMQITANKFLMETEIEKARLQVELGFMTQEALVTLVNNWRNVLNNLKADRAIMESNLNTIAGLTSELGDYYGGAAENAAEAAEEAKQAAIDLQNAIENFNTSVMDLRMEWMGQLEGAILNLALASEQTGIKVGPDGVNSDNFLEEFMKAMPLYMNEKELLSLENEIKNQTALATTDDERMYDATLNATMAALQTGSGIIQAIYATSKDICGAVGAAGVDAAAEAFGEAQRMKELEEWRRISEALKRLEEALLETTRSNEGGQYVAEVRQAWGVNGQDQVIADAVAAELGMLHVNVANFMELFDEAVAGGLTIEEFNDWRAMSDALLPLVVSTEDLLQGIKDAYLGNLSYYNSLEKAAYAMELAAYEKEQGNTQGYLDAMTKQLEFDKKTSVTREEYEAKFNKYINALAEVAVEEGADVQAVNELIDLNKKLDDITMQLERTPFQN